MGKRRGEWQEWMTDEMFDGKLAQILDRMSGKEILDIGTAREVFSEALRDRVLEALENDRDPEWGRFEIINPSDKAFIEGGFMACCLAMVVLSNGAYGLEEVDGDRRMPLFLNNRLASPFRSRHGKSMVGWFASNFGLDLGDALKDNRGTVREALASVALAGERSSTNDFSSYAHELAERMREEDGP